MTNLFTCLSNWKLKYLCALPVKLVAFLALFLIIGSGNVWGTDPSDTIFVASDTWTKTGTSGTGSATSVTKSGITVSSDKGYKDGTNHIREYSGCTITVSSTVGNIKSIEFTSTASGTSSNGPSKISLKGGEAGSYSYSGNKGTWSFGVGTSNVSSVTFSASAQFRWTQVIVTYLSSGPTITTSTTSISGVGYSTTDFSQEVKSFTVSGSSLTANVTVSAPDSFEVCKTSDGTYASSVTFDKGSGTLSASTVYVRLKSGKAAYNYSGNISCTSTGATEKTVALSGSVPFTVTWQANSGTHATTYVAYATGSGTAIGTLPTDPDPADYSCSGKEFYGWYTGSYSNLTTAPTPLVTTSTKVTGDVTFVAVFADEEVGDEAFARYQLVESAPSDWSGTYVLSTGTYTATGSYSSNTLASDSWTPGTTEATYREFIIAKIGETSTYSIKKGSTYYGYSGSKTDLTSDASGPNNSTPATAAKYAWTLSISGIKSNTDATRQLAGNSSTPTGIKAYSTSNIPGTNPAIKLYKRIEEPSVTYSDFVTTCSSSKVKTPQISLSAGAYIGSQSVTISCGTDGATIYYTTDNSTPSSSNGSTYSSAITISSTTTLKAVAVKDGLDDSNVASAAYTIRACKTYTLVTDVSTLGIGDKIVILETGGSCALNTTQNTSNHYRETTTDYAIVDGNVRVPDAACDVQTITLEPYPDASGYWYFNVGANAYLYASSSSDNNLETNTKVTAGANGKWSIALAAGVFTVKANGDKSHNQLRYNYNGGSTPRFTCYSSATQTAVKVYALQNTSPTMYVSTASLSGFSTTYGSASEKQDVIIYARNLTGNLTVTPPSGYEIKKSGDGSYSTSAITITPSDGSVTETVNVRIASGTSVGSPSGNISIAGNGNEVSTNIAVSGTVSKATPVITFTLEKSSAWLNEEVGYTLSTTIDGTLVFSYARGGSPVSAMITNDTENKTISISQKGTYKIRVNEASPDADKYNAAEQVERELVVSARDTFKDLVNGYSDITKDDDGSGTATPTFAEMEDGATDACNSTSRHLVGWIKATDLATQYGTPGETGYLEDVAGYNAAQLIAPGVAIEGTGATWYAVWGEVE